MSSRQLERRVHVVYSSLASLICLFAFFIGMVTGSDGSDANRSTPLKSARGKQITLRGCLFFNDENQGFGLVTGKDVPYDLVGNVRALPTHPDGLPVSIRGLELKPAAGEDEAPGKISVEQAQVLHPIADLHESLTDSSRWIRKTDQTYGLKLSVPLTAAAQSGTSLTDIYPDSVRIFDVNFAVYPRRASDDGELMVDVSTPAPVKDQLASATRAYSGKRNARTKKVERINGVEYTDLSCSSWVRYNSCSVSTVQNNLSYLFSFSFYIGQVGVVDWECLDPPINRDQEYAFVRLFLSRVAFSRPTVPSADGRPISLDTKPPEIVRFDKAPLAVHHAVNSGGTDYWTTDLSWKARDADYVQLSFNCVQGVDLLVKGVERSCDDSTLPDIVANQPPDSSQTITLSSGHLSGPVTVRFTLTPYSHGDRFEQSSKTVSLDVPPH